MFTGLTGSGRRSDGACSRPTDGADRTERTLTRTLRVAYPPGRGRMVLRTEKDWERSLEPVAVSEDGHVSPFELEADQPFLYFKPCPVESGRTHWAVGPNKLLLMTEKDARVSYPYFFGPEEGRSSALVELPSKLLGRDHKLRGYLPPGYDIKASSGLSDAEIEKMVKDAEAHAAEDKKFHELVTARNQADGMIHTTKKSMAELGDKMKAGEKEKIEAAIKELEEAMTGDDKGAIEAKTQALAEASGKMAERLYAQQGAAGQAGGESAQAASSGKDDVVDAEFEEVDEKKK